MSERMYQALNFQGALRKEQVLPYAKERSITRDGNEIILLDYDRQGLEAALIKSIARKLDAVEVRTQQEGPQIILDEVGIGNQGHQLRIPDLDCYLRLLLWNIPSYWKVFGGAIPLSDLELVKITTVPAEKSRWQFWRPDTIDTKTYRERPSGFCISGYTSPTQKDLSGLFDILKCEGYFVSRNPYTPGSRDNRSTSTSRARKEGYDPSLDAWILFS